MLAYMNEFLKSNNSEEKIKKVTHLKLIEKWCLIQFILKLFY